MTVNPSRSENVARRTTVIRIFCLRNTVKPFVSSQTIIQRRGSRYENYIERVLKPGAQNNPPKKSRDPQPCGVWCRTFRLQIHIRYWFRCYIVE